MIRFQLIGRANHHVAYGFLMETHALLGRYSTGDADAPPHEITLRCFCGTPAMQNDVACARCMQGLIDAAFDDEHK